MALNLIGTGGLFTRIGHLIHGVNRVVNTYRGTDLPARFDMIHGDYANADQNLVDNFYSQLSIARSANTPTLNYWRSLAQSTIIQMVNADSPQLKNNYQSALLYLYNYLVTNNQSVTRNTVTATITAGSGNHGNGVIALSLSDNRGFLQEQIFQENAIIRVTRDVQGGAASGQESFQINGTFGVVDTLHWLWPQGSNAQASTTAITPKSSGGTSNNKNWLANGTMDTFVTNVPMGWHVRIGTAGTSVLQSTADYSDGTSSLQFVGNGTELTSIRSQFGLDFPGKAQASDQLAVNLYYKVSGTPTAGVLKVSLTDATGTVLTDAAGVASSFSVSLVVGDSLWHSMSGFLRMPPILPTEVHLTISLDTALTASSSVNLDWISMARPTLFYPGGPRVACFTGNTNWMLGDNYTIATHNAFDGLMQSGCNQLLNLNNYGLILPSTIGTPTIPDTLVS